MTTKKDLRDEVDQLKQQSDDKSFGLLYKHPDTGDFHNNHKERIDPNSYDIIISLSWEMAPFVVERENAETRGWNIVQSVPDNRSDPPRDLVEVSEWCVNPWADDPDDRIVITDE